MTYRKFKEQQETEFNNFPKFWAFSREQFKEGLQKLGITNETLVRIPGGGFIRKQDEEAFSALLDKQWKEMEKALKDREFLVDAIRSELANHEYIVTFDHSRSLAALGVTLNDDFVRECFLEAKSQYIKDFEECN